MSTDPALGIGAEVTLRFKRPTGGDSIEVSGTVRELLGEGGLWRGRPAALIDLQPGVPEDFLGAPEARPAAAPRRRGSEAGGVVGRGLGGALLTTGLGRRRRTNGLSAPPPPPTPAEPADVAPPHSDPWPLVGDDDNDDSTAPPRATPLTGPDNPVPEDPVPDLSGEVSVPPVRTTQPELQAVEEARDLSEEYMLPPRADDSAEGDDDFFGMFGQVSDLPEYCLPPGAEDSGRIGSVPDGKPKGPTLLARDGYFDLDGSSEATAPPVAIEDSWIGECPEPRVAHSLPVPDDAGPPSDYEDLLNSGTHHPSALSEDPPVRNTMSIGGAGGPAPMQPPWESEPGDSNRALMSLIPRNARIASSLPVTFWARGRNNSAVAQNFSKEGLFLAFPGNPPVRGAIVRVEFPVEGDDCSVPVRFNAEVRWHTADRPGMDLPEGFGVQILTFESPKDRARYDELLLLILSLHSDQTAKENSFQWGGPGGHL